MALLHESVDQKKFDTRISQRNIERSLLRPEELDQFVKSLPDDSENATFVSLETLAADESGSN